jgi:hypothetical protein
MNYNHDEVLFHFDGKQERIELEVASLNNITTSKELHVIINFFLNTKKVSVWNKHPSVDGNVMHNNSNMK